MSKAHDDEKFFEQVADELEEGSRKKGLWLKAETKAGGDEDKARLLYIEWRVEQLSGEEFEAQRQKEEAELELHPENPPSQKKEKTPPKTLFTVQDGVELSGPYTLEELRARCRRNEFSADALVAIRGTNDWHDLFGDWVNSNNKKPLWLRRG